MFITNKASAALLLTGAMALAATSSATSMAATYVETPMFAAKVGAGKLPSVDQRLPKIPSVVKMTGERVIGRQGGELRTLIGRA